MVPSKTSNDIRLERPAGAVVPAKKWALTVVCYLCAANNGIGVASLGPMLADLARHTRSSLKGISFMFPTGAFGFLVGANTLGRLYDKFPSYVLMSCALFVVTLVRVVYPIIPSIGLMIPTQLSGGMSTGMLEIGIITTLAALHGDKSGSFFSAGRLFFGTGALSAPVVINYFREQTGDIHWSCWITAIYSLLVAIWILFPVHRLPKVSRDIQEQKAKTSNLLFLITAVLLFFLYSGTENSFHTWIFTYAKTLQMGSDASIAYLNSTFWAALMLGSLLVAVVAVYVKAQTILVADLVGCLVSFVCILLWPSSQQALWIGTIGLGLSAASTFPMTLAIVKQRIEITGAISGLFLAGGGIGGMVLPLIIGQLFESIGPMVAMYGMVINVVMAMVVFFLWRKLTKH